MEPRLAGGSTLDPPPPLPERKQFLAKSFLKGLKKKRERNPTSNSSGVPLPALPPSPLEPHRPWSWLCRHSSWTATTSSTEPTALQALQRKWIFSIFFKQLQFFLKLLEVQLCFQKRKIMGTISKIFKQLQMFLKLLERRLCIKKQVHVF